MNAMDTIMGVGEPFELVSGGVEMLGDRAVAVADIDNPAKYLEGKYTIQDRIDLGFAQNAAVIAPGGQLLFTAVCSSPFKPLEFVIDSTVATFLSVMSVVIGSAIYVEGGAVPGAIYSEVSLARKISWRTVQTTVPIQVLIRNDDIAAHAVKMAVRGFRLA